MAVLATCVSCSRSYRMCDELAGKKTKCRCGMAMWIPRSRSAKKRNTTTHMDDLLADVARLFQDEHPSDTARCWQSASARGRWGRGRWGRGRWGRLATTMSAILAIAMSVCVRAKHSEHLPDVRPGLQTVEEL